MRTYIYIYIQTLAQNRTAVIKISCLTTLGNESLQIQNLVKHEGDAEVLAQ